MGWLVYEEVVGVRTNGDDVVASSGYLCNGGHRGGDTKDRKGLEGDGVPL